MTTKPSSAPWADEPFHLIPTPSESLDESLPPVRWASMMAHAHNSLIRGLNAILQQAPHVPAAGEEGYVAQDVRDLLSYVRSWVLTVNHHHWVEEEHMFPKLDAYTGRPGLMDGPRNQHELFHDGLGRLMDYVTGREPGDYRWEGEEGMGAIMHSFTTHLTDHLYAEIETFLGLDDIDPDALGRACTEAEDAAKRAGSLSMLYELFPMVLGCVDKTYESGHDFPAFPWVMPYMVKYWFAAGNGAWRFNPCDWWGNPRPLQWTASSSS